MKKHLIDSTRSPALVVLVTLTWAGGTAWTNPPGGFDVAATADVLPAMEPIEAGVADQSDLSTSLRVIPTGLQEPIDFAQVYRLPGAEDQLLRAHGGLYAVFEESWYVPSNAGDVPIVPPGTRYYIGPPTDLSPPWAVDPTRLEMATTALRLDQRGLGRLETRIEAGVGREYPRREPEPMAWLQSTSAWSPTGRRSVLHPLAGELGLGRTVANDADFRSRRLRELLLAIASRDGP